MKWPLSSQEKHLEAVNKYVIKEFRKPQIYNQDNLEIAQEAEMAGNSNLVDENLIDFILHVWRSIVWKENILSSGKGLLSLTNYYNLGQFLTRTIPQPHLGSIEFDSMVGPSHQYA